MPANFTFHARYGLFTYAQCGEIDPFKLVDHYSSLEAECIIGREQHADGGTHLHVFADFGRKRKFRGTTVFDVEGQHPNIVPSRGSPRRGYEYATKDGDIVGGGLEPPAGGGDQTNSKDQTMAHLVSLESADEFWESIRELAPGLLLRNFPSLSSYASWRFRPRIEAYTTPSELSFCTESIRGLDDWCRGNIGVSSGVR